MENEVIKQPLVSIIIPAYNAEAFIGRTINDIKSQTVKNWELIIIDDGSKDRTSEICDTYATHDKRIRVIHKPNGGVSAARNTGLDAATGKYIAFIDADDSIIPQYLEAFVNSINDADICFFPMMEVLDHHDIPIYKDRNIFTIRKYTLQEGYPVLSERALIHPPYCKLFKREIIQKHALHFETDVAMGEDLLFNLSYLEYCKTMVIGEEIVYFYIKGNSVLSRTIRKDYADLQLRFYREREEFCQRHHINYTYKQQRFGILYEAYASITQSKHLSYIDKRDALTRIRKSKLAKEYLNECNASNTKECIFRTLLRLPIEYLFAMR